MASAEAAIVGAIAPPEATLHYPFKGEDAEAF
jgi:hypothetical protein